MSEDMVAAKAADFVEEDSKVADFFQLLKPRVMSLVVFTGLVGLYLAPGSIHPFIGFIAILCIALGSGAAGAINMWYERDIDAKMSRTKHRPLPSGRVDSASAIEFAIFAAFASVFIMFVVVNAVSAVLLLAAILFYVFVYTVWLKPRSVQNIVIGGAAGAFPPAIGWASVEGSLSVEPILLFLIIFVWTPPHFWALSLYRNQDYRDAGIPMMPVIKGNDYTRKQIFLYSLLMFVVSLLPVFFSSGLIYLVTASVLGMVFLYKAFILFKNYEEVLAKRLFGYSIMYLFLLFVSLIVDKIFLFKVNFL